MSRRTKITRLEGFTTLLLGAYIGFGLTLFISGFFIAAMSTQK